jgi:hypothetical protein
VGEQHVGAWIVKVVGGHVDVSAAWVVRIGAMTGASRVTTEPGKAVFTTRATALDWMKANHASAGCAVPLADELLECEARRTP